MLKDWPGKVTCTTELKVRHKGMNWANHRLAGKDDRYWVPIVMMFKGSKMDLY